MPGAADAGDGLTPAHREADVVAAPTAAARILDAAVEALVRSGAGALAMHDVAARADVSKGLIHYHYRDKDALLTAAAARLGTRISVRERRALALSSSAAAVDDLRRWMETELEAGEWRALLSLVQWPAAAVAAAAREALDERRAMAALTISRFFELLGMRPRIAPELIGGLVVALVSGLAAAPVAGGDRRAAGDVLALALLGLAE